jgi:hypothetical protein
MNAGIEKCHETSRIRVIGAYVWSFESIAAETRESQIVTYSSAVVLNRDDVVRLVAVEGC